MSTVKPSKENICTIIVTFNPDGDFVQRVEAIASQVDHVIIFDNHSGDSFQNVLKSFESDNKIDVICSEANVGIAAALNTAVSQAKEKGYAWVLTLDHDSTAKPLMIDTYIQCYQAFENKDSIALIGCNHIDANSGQPYIDRDKYEGKEWIERKTIITSGTFMPITVFEKIGKFREDLFLDSVDHEYCLRSRKNGYRVYLVLESLLEHTMGNREVHSSRLNIVTTNYAPFRWYYITRNRIILAKEYFFHDPLWAITALLRVDGWVFLMLLTEKKRREKTKNILLGFWDGIRSNTSRKIETLLNKK